MSRANNHLAAFNDSINSTNNVNVSGRNSALSKNSLNNASTASSVTPEKLKQPARNCCKFKRGNVIDRSERHFFINDYERNMLERTFEDNYV